MGSSRNSGSSPITRRIADIVVKKNKTDAMPPRDELNAAYLERDRARRLAKRAQGRDSTVRTGPGGAPYSAAPKSLLGS